MWVVKVDQLLTEIKWSFFCSTGFEFSKAGVPLQFATTWDQGTINYENNKRTKNVDFIVFMFLGLGFFMKMTVR